MDHLEDYATNADRFGAVVDAAPADSWDSPSPCEEWTAAQLVDHVVDTQRDFLARQGVDVGARPEGDPGTVWKGHRAALATALDRATAEREYDGHFGRTTIGETLASFYGFDMVVHRWDLAAATGQDGSFTEEEMDRLERSIAGFGDQLYSEGVCKPAVPAPDGASRQQRLLALMGRAA